MTSSKYLKFKKGPDSEGKSKGSSPWKILIVDDEIEVFHTTNRILEGIAVFERGIKCYSATSMAETGDQLNNHPDMALILLDIMMEDDDTGFKVIEYIRNHLNNKLVQIIIQTGQPGYAPENTLISEYDINNYLNKSSLTAQKLYTAVVASIRSFRLNLSLQNEITAHKESMEKIDILRQAAEESSLTKSRFLANITHELRTPMHAILGFSNLGLQKYKSLTLDKLYNYFMTINKSGHRLLDLLNNLLDLSKLDVGKMDYLMKENSINKVVEMIVTEFSPVFISKNAHIDIDYQKEDLDFVFDYYKIAQVIRNLVSNAIKFSQQNPYIHISVRTHNKGIDSEHVDTTFVSISDKGVGIPEDETVKIFEKFYESSRTQTDAGGRGLGLAICQKIISAHEGKIWVEPNPDGIGSQFSFTIPHNLKSQSFFSGH